MLSDDFINDQKKNLIELGNKLHSEAMFAKQYLESRNPENEKKWANSILSVCVYGTFLIKNILDSLESYRDKSEEQIGFYIGKIAIQSFLETINVFERSTNDLVSQNSFLSEMLNFRINEKVRLIEASWDENSTGKARKLKNSLIRAQKWKISEMQFIRETMYKNGVIDDLDKKILDFAWDIRNSMHANFVAIKDIEFSAPGTSLGYSFSFSKGEELYHPVDLLSFYSMTEQIIFIQIKVIQHFNKLVNT